MSTVVDSSGMLHAVFITAVTFLVFVLDCVLSACDFPVFVQSRAHSDHHWVAIYSYSEHLTTKFLDGTMRASHCKNNKCHAFNRTCQMSYGNNMYLVSHKDSQNTIKFLCMQFLKRSSGVFQLMTSRQSSRAIKTLCYEMKLDSVPLISNKHYYKTKVICPLTGGFDITLFDWDLSQLCPDSPVPIRLESECDYNEGMSFRFRQKECIHHDLSMKFEQKVYCIADWTNSRHTFVVLRDNSSFRTWCLRYLSAAGDNKDRFWAYLFMDFICDPTETVTESSRFLHLELKRRVSPSLCVDEFHHCRRDKLFLCHSDRKHNCALTCGLCDPYGSVYSCQFDELLHGTWMQSTSEGNQKVTITGQELSIGEKEKYQCVKFNNSSTKSSLSMLRIYENGCYPRFVCGEFSRPAPSVLHYRLGNSVVWPIFHEKDPYSAICSDKSFHSTLRPRHNNDHGFQFDVPQKSQTSVVNLDDERAVFCNLSVEFATKIAFVDRFNCTGCLSQDSAGTSDRLSMHYNNCSNQPDYVEYLCLASFKTIGANDRLLTRIVRNKDRYFCWVFVSTVKVIVLPGSKCDAAVSHQVETGKYHPIDVLLLGSLNGTSCETLADREGDFSDVIPSMSSISGGSFAQKSAELCVLLFICVMQSFMTLSILLQ